MVAVAEKYKAEYNAQKEKVETLNQLENFLYQFKNMAGEQLGDKMNVDDKAAIEKASNEGLELLDSRQDASKLETETKMNDVDGVIRPIVANEEQYVGSTGRMAEASWIGFLVTSIDTLRRLVFCMKVGIYKEADRR